MEAWLRLYHACDWYRDGTVDNLEAVRNHAYLIVTGWLGAEMVATLTVLSDGMNYATIDDVVVHPEHRRRGIGSELMRQALSRITHIDPGVIKLHAIPGVEPFYAQLGFAASRETVMFFRPEGSA